MNIYQIFKLLYRDRAFNPNPKLPPKTDCVQCLFVFFLMIFVCIYPVLRVSRLKMRACPQ